MAGIKEAMKRVMDGRNTGIVVAKGRLKDCDCGENEKCTDCSSIEYIIIRLDHDDGLITQYDYGSDIHIADDIKKRDPVQLMINDNWNATWEKWSGIKQATVTTAERTET